MGLFRSDQNIDEQVIGLLKKSLYKREEANTHVPREGTRYLTPEDREYREIDRRLRQAEKHHSDAIALASRNWSQVDPELRLLVEEYRDNPPPFSVHHDGTYKQNNVLGV